MKRILIVHHLEPMWEAGYKMFGTSFERELERMAEHLEENDYDTVVLTRFEDFTLSPEHYLIADKISHVREYGYAWTNEMREESPEEFCEGGRHSEAVYLAPWMFELKNCEVEIAGAFDGECIDDLETALNHLGVTYKRLDNLIVG